MLNRWPVRILKLRAVISSAALARQPGEAAMRFRGFPSTLVILSALAVPAATSSAQGPAAPSAFDGRYVGTATLAGGRGFDTCATLTSADMTITGGQVVIHEIVLTDTPGLCREASTQRERCRHPSNPSIGKKGVGGHRDRPLTTCPEPSMTRYSQVCTVMDIGVTGTSKCPPRPRRTMPFDGEYRGVVPRGVGQREQ